MDTTAPPKKASKPVQAPLSPSRVRYGLMNPRGEYLVVPFQVNGKWQEWSTCSTTAIRWVDFDAVHDAQKTWNSLHFDNGPVTVVKV